MTRLQAFASLIVAVFGLSFITVEPAQADIGGRVNLSEFFAIDWQVPGSDTQAQVEDKCNCTGEVTARFKHNDNPAKRVRYANTDGGFAKIYYVRRDDDKWHVYDKAWCSDGVCFGPSKSSLQEWGEARPYSKGWNPDVWT